jgi:response regulator RpfG family c-di-GMP phosphodiesterase
MAMESLTVLCIDDRSQVLMLRKATLNADGYYVKPASSRYTAIKTLAKMPVAAVLQEYKQEGNDVEAIAYHVK